MKTMRNHRAQKNRRKRKIRIPFRINRNITAQAVWLIRVFGAFLANACELIFDLAILTPKRIASGRPNFISTILNKTPNEYCESNPLALNPAGTLSPLGEWEPSTVNSTAHETAANDKETW